MSWIEEVEVLWPVDLLVSIGFNQAEAERLHPLLPPVEAGTISDADLWGSGVLRTDDDRYNPVSAIIWGTHDLNARVAVRLADTGRDVLDLIAILDAAVACHPDRLWTPGKVALVESWVNEPRVPISDVPVYMAAGVTAAEAVAYTDDPAVRPTEAQLALLAALRANRQHPKEAPIT